MSQLHVLRLVANRLNLYKDYSSKKLVIHLCCLLKMLIKDLPIVAKQFFGYVININICKIFDS